MASESGLRKISVRFNASIPKVIDVQIDWTCLKVKEEIARKFGVNISIVKLIFQGKDVPDEWTLDDMGLGNFSVLDAVKHKGIQPNYPTLAEVSMENLVTEGVGSVYLRRTSTGAGDEPSVVNTTGAKKSFYVYCKSRCNDIKPGKLRVRCATCKKGTLTIHRDPNNWDDVLKRCTITGECQQDDCNGQYAEFYFKCAAHETEEDETSAVLPRVMTNTGQVPCILCGDAWDAMLVFECPSQHTICLGCFSQYANVNLNDRRFVLSEEYGYTLNCPGYSDGCSEACIKDPHYFRIMGDEMYEKYQKFATEEMLMSSGGLICPGKDCGEGIFYAGAGNRVQCHTCKFEFCKLCRDAYHPGECHINRREELQRLASGRGGVSREAADQARWMLATYDTIDNTTKECPNCKSRIEKNDGCMHMTCAKCRHDFCWLCLTPWGRNCQENHWFG